MDNLSKQSSDERMSSAAVTVTEYCFHPHAKLGWTPGTVQVEVATSRYEVSTSSLSSTATPQRKRRTASEVEGKNSHDKLPKRSLQDGAETPYDLAEMDYYHEASVLHTLRTRLLTGKPYTMAGDVLISVNPYKRHRELYTEEVRQRYIECNATDLEPHVFGISAAVYWAMVERRQSQTVVVSGQKSSGKSEATKLLLSHLADLSSTRGVYNAPRDTSSEHNRRLALLKGGVTLLESFSNASMAGSYNSSRVALHTTLNFSPEKLKLEGSEIRAYLLERSRAIRGGGTWKEGAGNQGRQGSRGNKHQGNTGCNFHIMYELLAAPTDVKGALLLTGDWRHYEYAHTEMLPSETTKPPRGGHGEANAADGQPLTPETKAMMGAQLQLQLQVDDSASVAEPWRVDLPEQFEKTVKALREVAGLNEEDVQSVLKALAAVLHLGNIQMRNFDEEDHERTFGTVDIVSLSPVKAAAKLLECSPHDIANLLTMKELGLSGGGVTLPKTWEEAIDTRDAIAMLVYDRLFSWLLRKINEQQAAVLPPQKKKRGSVSSDGAGSGGESRRGSDSSTSSTYPSSPSPSPSPWLSISTLDSFGLEECGKERCNVLAGNLQQLCANWCHEKLRAIFLNDVIPDVAQALPVANASAMSAAIFSFNFKALSEDNYFLPNPSSPSFLSSSPTLPPSLGPSRPSLSITTSPSAALLEVVGWAKLRASVMKVERELEGSGCKANNSSSKGNSSGKESKQAGGAWQQKGVLQVLREECHKTKGSDVTFAERLHEQSRSQLPLQVDGDNKSGSNSSSNSQLATSTSSPLLFPVRHYLGKLTYSTKGMVSGPGAKPPADVETLIRDRCKNPCLKCPKAPSTRKGDDEGGDKRNEADTREGPVIPAAPSQLAQVDELLARLNRTQRRYVHCINPNERRQSVSVEAAAAAATATTGSSDGSGAILNAADAVTAVVDSTLLLHQLRGSGVLAAAEVKHLLRPPEVRLRKKDFFRMFGKLPQSITWVLDCTDGSCVVGYRQILFKDKAMMQQVMAPRKWLEDESARRIQRVYRIKLWQRWRKQQEEVAAAQRRKEREEWRWQQELARRQQKEAEEVERKRQEELQTQIEEQARQATLAAEAERLRLWELSMQKEREQRELEEALRARAPLPVSAWQEEEKAEEEEAPKASTPPHHRRHSTDSSKKRSSSNSHQPRHSTGSIADVIVPRVPSFFSAGPTINLRGSSIGEMRSFVSFSLPQVYRTARCRMVRHRDEQAARGRGIVGGTSGLKGWRAALNNNPFFTLRLEDGGTFLMAAQRQTLSRTALYRLSLSSAGHVDKGSRYYLGKLRAQDTAGSAFVLYDDGVKPLKKDQNKGFAYRTHDAEHKDDADNSSDRGAGGGGAQPRKELCGVTFRAVEDDIDAGPRYIHAAMYASIAASSSTSNPPSTSALTSTLSPNNLHLRRRSSGSSVEDELVSRMMEERARDDEDLLIFRNRRPYYNEEVRDFAIDFHGRATKVSVKNFILVAERSGSETAAARSNHHRRSSSASSALGSDPRECQSAVLLLGKMSENEFALDFCWPMSPLQAFGIALAAMDSSV